MKTLAKILPLALGLCLIIHCQDKGSVRELEKLKAQARLEEQSKNIIKRWISEVDRENFAKFGINAWKSWWKDFDIPVYLDKIYKCFSTDEDFKMEILRQTDTSVEARMNIFGKSWMKVFSESGVTDDEYIRFLGAHMASLAEYIGFDCEQKLEGDWIYFRVSEK